VPRSVSPASRWMAVGSAAAVVIAAAGVGAAGAAVVLLGAAAASGERCDKLPRAGDTPFAAFPGLSGALSSWSGELSNWIWIEVY
jgi:hypothetical protein